MTLEFILQLLEKGFTTFVAVLAVLTVYGGWKISAKYAPKVFDAGKEFVGVWSSFVKAMEKNAEAIDKNTRITDMNHQQSEVVLDELKDFNAKFIEHDLNALEIKKMIDELIVLFEKNNTSKEVIDLLKFIIEKLENDTSME